MLITHKLVLVTGASGGIEAAIAKEMANAGGRLILLARREEALEQVAQEIHVSGGEACSLYLKSPDKPARMSRCAPLYRT